MNTLKDYVEWKLTHSDKTAVAEGYPLILEKCKKNKKMKDLKVYGNSVQDGTPSPENPIEVLSVGVKTRNLYNHSTAKSVKQWNISNANVKFGAGTITSVTTTDATSGFLLIKVGNASDYRSKSISCTWKPKTDNVKTTNTVMCIYDANNNSVKDTYSKALDNGYYHNVISIPETVADTDNLIFRMYLGDSKKGDTIAVSDVMIYEGTEPLPYEPYGKYKISFVQRGKNIFKPDMVSASAYTSDNASSVPSNNRGTVIDSTNLKDNTVIITQTPNLDYTGVAYQNGHFIFKTYGLVEGEKYILSFDIDITSNPLGASDIVIFPGGEYPSYSASFSGNKQRISVTFTEKRHTDVKRPAYLEIRCCGMSFTASNFMITEVGHDTEFEPYIEPQVHNVFLDEPLRKVGDYADYVDFKNQKVVRNTGSTIFNGTENWIYEKLSYGNNFYVKIPDAVPDRNTEVMCNMGTWISWTMSNPYNIRISENGNFNFRYEDYDNLTDFKNKLSEMHLNNQPLNVTYALKTEAFEDISCQLPKTTAKTTVFTVDSEIVPSNMYGKYIK